MSRALRGRGGGQRKKILRDGGAREFEAPESARIETNLPGLPDRRVSARERSEQALSAEKRLLAPAVPTHTTSGGQWMDRANNPDLGTWALPLPSCNVPSSAAAAPDNEPANCSACRGKKTVAER